MTTGIDAIPRIDVGSHDGPAQMPYVMEGSPAMDRMTLLRSAAAPSGLCDIDRFAQWLGVSPAKLDRVLPLLDIAPRRMVTSEEAQRFASVLVGFGRTDPGDRVEDARA